MKTVAFVPIKLNNERLPGKNLKKFSDGTPLVKIILNKLAALKGDCIDKVYCYCSSKEIVAYLPDGVEWLQRPIFLDDKYCTGRAIYEEFVKTVDADVYILCHATAPFTTTAHIKECINAVQSGKYSSAFAGQNLQTFFGKMENPLISILAIHHEHRIWSHFTLKIHLPMYLQKNYLPDCMPGAV